MQDAYDARLTELLTPLNLLELSQDDGYSKTQIGHYVDVYEDSFPDLEKADLILVGMSESRGAGRLNTDTNSADQVRQELFKLFLWHKKIIIADIGNIKTGKNLNDSYAALKMVLNELANFKAKVLILGGSHDLTLAQCASFESQDRTFTLTTVDAKIDLNPDSTAPQDKFLLELFTKAPNYLDHYNHIGFQSYFVHPDMLETIDKLRFDCTRVGKVKEMIQEMEPSIRNSDIFSFDISCIQHAHAPANHLTPNGFNGEEACTLMQFAGLSSKVRTVGIYGYFQELDQNNLTAKQISHLIWYLVDGIYQGKQEADFESRIQYNEFHLAFAEVETTFLQSKRTNRWWMQMPDNSFIACSHLDYILATQNEIPERYLRAIERS